MWNALRSDFQEFVSTVADDTSNVLQKLDSGLDENNEDEENHDMMEGEEDDKQEAVVNHAELKEIMTLLRSHPGTYTEDLADEDETEQVEEYLKEFSIEARTDEIAKILEEHEDTVKKHFEELCPTQVSYEDFWKRYFYRCDEERIARQLREETERARKARAEAIQGGIDTVTNFFGGAVKAVTNTIAPEASGAETPNSEAGINFFGAKGRPPFVMNTAMDESGESADGIEEDDEEELGWDDDDDDDDFLEEESGADTATEQIEFKDKVSEDLEEQLKQAIAERDQIQQTVQMQAAEIKSLQTKVSGGEGGGDTASGGELEEIKLKLFEKDAELAALKARLHDDDTEDGTDTVASLIRALKKLPGDELSKLRAEVFGMEETKDAGEAEKVASLALQVQQLQKDLATKEASLADTNKKLNSSIQELESTRSQLTKDQAHAQKAGGAMDELNAKLKSALADANSLQAENDALKQAAQQAQQENASQLSAIQQDHADSQKQVSSLTAEVESLKQKLQETEESLKQKEADLAAAKQASAAPSSPESHSTGVKVDTPAAVATPLMPEAANGNLAPGDVGDDWGDDW